MPRTRKKLQPMKYPAGVEYSYRVILYQLVNELRKQLKKTLAPIVPKLVLEASDIHALPHGEIRQDAWRDDLERALQKISKDMMQPKSKAIRDMLAVGPRVEQYNKAEWNKLIRSQYGVNPTREDADRWASTLETFSKKNALLINDIPNKTIQQVQEETVDALMSGKSTKEMTEDIFDIMSERTEVSESRAELIARDQVAKLNGQFTMERQADLGVEKYVWRTVGDERVRETHASVDGKVFDWNTPPIETDLNHPGEDYQCRCYAEPILPEIAEFQASLLDEMEEAA